MTCGLGLGLLVIFLIQAERVCCLWTKAQSFQNRNTYVGFPPADRLKSSNYPQNQVRQGFISPHLVQSSSSNTAVYTGSGPVLSSRRAHVSQPVRSVQSSSVFKANRKRPFSPRTNTAKQSVFSAGTSVSRHQNPPGSRRSRPVQQESRRGSSPPHGSREGYSFRPASQAAAQDSSRPAVKIPLSYSKTGSSAVLFGPVAPGPPGRSAQMQTYARGPAKRVSTSRRSKESKARSLAPQTQAGSSVEGSRPRSWLQSYKTSGLAVPRSSTVGAPAQGLAPATVHEIPEHFGGSAIRRLKEPAVHKQQISSQRLVPSAPRLPVSRWH